MALSPLIDTALGLALIFFVFSMVASGINEAITRALGTRSKHLWRSLRRLLEESGRPTSLAPTKRAFEGLVGPNGQARDPRPSVVTLGSSRTDSAAGTDRAGTKVSAEALLAHPLVAALDGDSGRIFRGDKTRLSHIDPDTFSRALLDLLEPGKEIDVDQLTTKLAADDYPFGTELLALIKSGADTVEKLRDAVAGWFDERMEALSKAYRRRTRWWLFAIALVVSVVANVDAVHAADSLWDDEAQRAALVAAAENCVVGEGGEAKEPKDCKTDDLELPIAVDRQLDAAALAGWAISGAAIAQGGPFWFDVMRRIAGFRKAAMGG